jgi:hypothetical protein
MIERGATTSIRLALTLLATAAISACGGGTTETESSVDSRESPLAVSGSGSWVKVSSEDKWFTVGSSQTVRFGTGSSWIEKVVSGTAPCTRTYFGGDPALNVVKECDVWSPATTSATWSKVASEGQSFTVGTSQTVRFGAGSSWIQKVVSGTAPCTRTYFGGDPAVNVAKQCDLATSTTVSSTAKTTPKVAVVDYSGSDTYSNLSRLAKYKFAVIGMWSSMGASRMTTAVSTIKSLNPTIKVAQYTSVGEMHDQSAEAKQQLDSTNGWLRNQYDQRVTWGSAYRTNLTGWANANSSGQRWPQWKAVYDNNAFFKAVPQIDYVFIDSVMYQAVEADWRNAGTNQLWTDTTVQSETRKGFASYWNTLRSVNGNVKVIANIHTEILASPEAAGQLEGAFLEGQIGKTWSYETWGGWTKAMDVYRAALRNTKSPKSVVFQAYGSSTDYARVRYGLASTLMEDGYFAYNVPDLTQATPFYDEFSAPLGDAAEAPPTAPTASGIWMRRYSNGLVLVNPTTASASINVGSGYKRIAGTLDPGVNNGMAESVVTLLPKQGLVMVKQ